MRTARWWFGLMGAVAAVVVAMNVLKNQESERSMNEQARTTAGGGQGEGGATGGRVATFGGGCYWCLEAGYRQLAGVKRVESGFMGGHVVAPSYEEVCGGMTGHVEVVRVEYDPGEVSYEDLLSWFWKMHDPTTEDRQGGDVGPQYRSVIFYEGEDQRKAAELSKAAEQERLGQVVVTRIEQAKEFYAAPEGHQNYYFQNKQRNPYCRLVIEPKLKKLGMEH